MGTIIVPMAVTSNAGSEQFQVPLEIDDGELALLDHPVDYPPMAILAPTEV
jgi:hypothetical protein